MKLLANVTAVLFNPITGSPDGIVEEQFPVELPSGSKDEQKQACLQLLTAVRASGGFLRYIDNGHINFIPLSRVKDIDIRLSAVGLADNFDLAKATGGVIQP